MTDPDFIHIYIPPAEVGLRTLLLLHAEDGDENELLPLGGEIDPTAGLLAVRGGVRQGDGLRFFRRLPLEALDRDELIRRAHGLADFVGRAADAYGFDASTVFAVGRANGASLAAGVLVYRPEALLGGALLNASAPPPPSHSPSLRAKRVLLVAGEQDPLVPVEETTRLHTMLHRYGAEAETLWFPGSDTLTPDKSQAIAAWLETL